MANGEGLFYVAPWNEEIRIAPSEVNRLSPEQQFQLIRHWFFQMFEDPANELPFDKEEGAYRFLWGGPYDAEDVIVEEFVELISRDILDSVVADVEKDGALQWAPTAINPKYTGSDETPFLEFEHGFEGNTGRPDTSSFLRSSFLRPDTGQSASSLLDEIDERLGGGTNPSFGGNIEREKRKELRVHAIDLKALLQKSDQSAPKHGGIGHNRPPKGLVLNDDQAKALGEAADLISTEIDKTEPDVLNISRATRVLQRIITYFASKADMGFDAFINSFSSNLGKYAARAVVGTAVLLFAAVLDWLNMITLPF